MVAPYPVDHPEWIDRETEEQMEGFQELVTGIRTTRSENNIDPRKKIPVELVCEGSDRSFLESQNEQIRLLAHLSQVDLVPRFQAEGRRVQGVSRLADFALILDEVVDEGADRQRLNQQISRSEENVQRLQKQLENSDFVNKAPEPVVAAARERHAEAVEQLEKLQEKLDGLSQP